MDDGLHRTLPESRQTSPESTGVWRSAVGLWRNPVECGGTPVGLWWDCGGTPVESSGKQGVGGCWVSLGLKFGPEPKFEPELLRTRSKFSPKFSILLN